MQKNKFVKFLSKLSKNEIKAFSKHLASIHTEKHVLFRLLEHIKKYHPSFDSKKMKSEEVFYKIYGAKPFNGKLLLTQVSKLRAELKRFLIWNHQEDFSYESNFILLKLYKKYGLKDEVEKQLAKMKKHNEEEKRKDLWYWQRKMRLAHEHYHYIATERINNSVVQIHEAMDSLDLFYAVAKLQYSSEYYNRENVFKQATPKIKFLEELNQTKWDNSFLLHHCYQLALSMIRERSESSFYALKKIVFEQSTDFHKNDRFALITYLLNHFSASIRQGNYSLVDQVFELYKYGIDDELFIVDGHFEYNHFENIINIACKLEAFEWVEQFFKRWKDTLNDDKREDVILLSESFIWFKKKEFDKIISVFSLHKNRFKSLYHRAKFYVLNIAASVETNIDAERIVYKCRALERNVRDDKLMSKAMEKALLNFSKLVRALSDYKPDKRKLENMMQEFGDLHFRFWLEEKIEML